MCHFKVKKIWWPNLAFHLMYCSLNNTCLKTRILWLEIFMGRAGLLALLKVIKLSDVCNEKIKVWLNVKC